jgi:ABC-type uncharacterized transport system substrate-binding protein
MKNLIKDLWLAVLLIILASAILLLSDQQQRKDRKLIRKSDYPLIAMMQISSSTLLDAHAEGVISRLKEKGYYAPDGHNVRRFNPQGDFGTANSIAGEIVNGPYEMVITTSTVALQVFAGANQSTRKTHVFGAVTDPYGAGVGISGPEPDQHPPYMTGVGTFQPVKRAFELIRELNPIIKRIGVVWNPGEQCSEACIRIARDICTELGIELMEATATNTSEVPEAVRSLMAKNIEAIWVGGDTVAASSIGLIVSIAKTAKIPVFTNDPADPDAGALFGLGANYFTVGEYTADMAVSIFEGAAPSSFRIENVVPEQFRFNHQVFATLDNPWTISQAIRALLDENASNTQEELIVLDFADHLTKGKKPSLEMIEAANYYRNASLIRSRPASVALISLVENRLLEEAEEGVMAGLIESGLRPDNDFITKRYSAQGEIAQLPQIIDAAMQEKPDVIVTVTTPVMMAIVKKVKETPVVFTVTSDPKKLNVFISGRPDNVCGVHDNPPVAEVLDMAIAYDNGLKNAGIVYDASQMNSLLSVEKLRVAGKEKGITITEATASSVTDLSMATQSLVQRGVQAIIISADNLANTGFSVIHRVAQSAGIPIFATEPSLVEQGATGAYGDDFYDWGRQSGRLAAKVIAGVPPHRLPLTETISHKRIEPKKDPAINQDRTPYKLRMVLYSETEFAERCHDGLIDGINQAGFIEGLHYNLKVFNAQGDMSTLSSIMNTVKADRADLLMVVSTPTLQAALRLAGAETKIVFTGVGDAVKAGAGKSETDHLPNVTGITTRSPFAGMARMIKETLPGTQRVGTLFTPAEINSELYKGWFEEALKKEGFDLVTVPVTSSADIAQAATELCGKDIQVLCQIVDNLTRPGFALIARKAAENNLPVFVFDSDQMKDGGVVCLSRDYYDAGLEAAAKAVRVMEGEHPSQIPFSNTQSEKLLINQDLAGQYHLNIPEHILKKATYYPPQKE